MTHVGIRELRNHLSRYLQRVKAGEPVVVTARGRACWNSKTCPSPATLV